MCGVLACFSMSADKLNIDAWAGLRQLGHRGPDNSDIYMDDLVVLAHSRLSIIDLNNGADQPYSYKNYRMVYNGEVFNYLELKADLLLLGYSFDTQSDTEVVIKCYEHYGPSCVEKFNGMWSFIITDISTNHCFVSRDRFGQKPLFYYQSSKGVLYFASEIQALLPYVKMVTPNLVSIASFLREGDFDCEGNTFFEDIYEFPSAHNLEFDCSKTTIISFSRYWSYPKKVTKKGSDGFLELLEDAVDLRLRTDVSYGVLLSGGIDSTIIASLTRKIVGQEQKVAAVTYSSLDADDESVYAKEIAKALNFDISVKERSSDITQYKDRLRLLVKHLGRGHSSPAIISVDQLYSQVADSDLKVALDGQGADELLAGYKHYHVPLMMDLIKRCRWRELISLSKDFANEGPINIMIMTLRGFLTGPLKKVMRQLYGYEQLLGQSLLKNEVEKIGRFKESKDLTQNSSFLNRYLEKQHRLGLSNLLYYGDIVAMVNSVENRSPFMDHRLVEYAFSCDESLKVRDGQNKVVLKDSIHYQKFETFLDRKKVGFNSPLSAELKQSMLSDLSSSPLLSNNIIDKNVFARLVSNQDIESEKMERFLFRIYQVHLWWNLFINRETHYE